MPISAHMPPKADPITPPVYNEYLKQLGLKRIRLVTLEAKLEGDMPDGPVRVSLEFNAEENMDSRDFAPRATFTAVAGSGKEKLFRVHAEYVVVFEAPSAPPPGFCDVFFPRNLHQLVLPFFREVVASASTRMDLPSVIIPMKIGSAPSDKAVEPRKAKPRRPAASAASSAAQQHSQG